MTRKRITKKEREARRDCGVCGSNVSGLSPPSQSGTVKPEAVYQGLEGPLVSSVKDWFYFSILFGNN